MELSRLYELLERFHRTNQLPAFLLGIVVTVAVGYFVLRFLRLRIVNVWARDGEIRRLDKRVDELTAENDQLRRELRHAEKHADVVKIRIVELTGQLQAQNRTSATLGTACERLKKRLMDQQGVIRKQSEFRTKARRLVENLRAKLERIELSDGRIWEVAPPGNVTQFRPLSQRRTPILSLVNLKGGVGKTTIAANLAVAMNQLGWRVLVVDLDHQSSLSQLLLSRSEMDELIVSRRLIHDALQDPVDGLGRFRKAIVRVSTIEEAKIFLVAADEELGDLEMVLSQRWLARMTDDDVRYRLRAILHSEQITEQFDFILLDCPPRLTTACINALMASDYALIPVLPNPTSTAAVPRLLRWLKHLRQVACPELSVIGVIGNKAKYYGDVPVKKQQTELDSLAELCRDQWGDPVKFFSPLRTHDALVQPLPALDPRLRGAYLDLVFQLNKELPSYARSRDSKLSPSIDHPVGSIGR